MFYFHCNNTSDEEPLPLRLESVSSDHSDDGSLGGAVSLASSGSCDRAVDSPSPVVRRSSRVSSRPPRMTTSDYVFR